MRIAFYAGSCIPIHARSAEERPLGGTEMGLIRLAEILQRRGHEVTVYTAMHNPPASSPRYVFEREILRARDLEVLVAIQNIDAVNYGIPCKRLFYWTGDGPDQFANFGIGDRRTSNRIEKMICVSNWQADALCGASGFPREKVINIGNGAHLPYFEGNEPRKRKRLMYASAPYRGLELVPAIYQRVREIHPDAELAVFAGMQLYDRDKPFEGPEKELERRLIPILRSLPNCQISPPVTQAQLVREYMRSAVLVYPNIVFETCCMVALEAIAAGCPAVTSRNSALPETVGDCGFTIGGELGSPAYLDEFSKTVSKLLSDDTLWNSLHERCRARAAAELSWEKVADRFEQLL